MLDNYFHHLRNSIDNLDLESLKRISKAIRLASEKGKTIYAIGNGGSATTASHFAVDLAKGAGVRAVSLCDNFGLLTAISNDLHFIDSYAEQVELSLKRGDVLVIISVSGDSLNLVRAAVKARAKGVKVVGLLGRGGKGTVSWSCDEVSPVYSNDYGAVEDLHLAMCHAITQELKK